MLPKRHRTFFNSRSATAGMNSSRKISRSHDKKAAQEFDLQAGAHPELHEQQHQPGENMKDVTIFNDSVKSQSVNEAAARAILESDAAAQQQVSAREAEQQTIFNVKTTTEFNHAARKERSIAKKNRTSAANSGQPRGFAKPAMTGKNFKRINMLNVQRLDSVFNNAQSFDGAADDQIRSQTLSKDFVHPQAMQNIAAMHASDNSSQVAAPASHFGTIQSKNPLLTQSQSASDGEGDERPLSVEQRKQMKRQERKHDTIV